MITQENFNQLANSFKRIFSMPITRSTFREVQNAIVAASGQDSEVSTFIFESLLTGEVKKGKWLDKNESLMLQLLNDFSVQARVSKDVYERGEFISVASSDIISQTNRIAFLNRFRRVDGQELHFLTDVKGTVNLLQHIVGRLQELNKNEKGRNVLKEADSELKKVMEMLGQIS